MWKKNLPVVVQPKKIRPEDMEPEDYLKEFNVKMLKEYEYVEEYAARRERARNALPAFQRLRPDELSKYIHSNVINFETSFLVHSGSVETIVKPRFKQYMHFHEVLTGRIIKPNVFDIKIPTIVKVFPRVITRKYTNDSSVGYTIHERTPKVPVPVPVSAPVPVPRVRRICKKRKVIYNRNMNSNINLNNRSINLNVRSVPYLRGFRSRSTRTGGKPTYEPFIWASSYESTLFSEAVEFGCKPRPFKRCSPIPQKPWVKYWK